MPRRPKDPQRSLDLRLPGAPTVQVLIGNFEAEVVVTHRKGTQPSERARLHWWAANLPPQPTQADVIGALEKRMASTAGMAETTANLYLKTLGAVYKYGPQRYPLAVVRSPLIGVPRFAEPLKKPVHVPAAAWKKLLAAMPDTTARSLLHVLYWLGLRISEALGLQVQHVDLRRNRLIVVQQRRADTWVAALPKTVASAAELPLHPAAALALRARLAELRLQGAGPEEWLHPYRAKCYQCGGLPNAQPCGDPTCLKGLLGLCRRIAPEAFPTKARGRGGRAFHGFRHSTGERMARNHRPAQEVQAMLRQASLSAASTYMGRFRGRELTEDVAQRAWADDDADGTETSLSTSRLHGTQAEAPTKAKGRSK